MKNSILITTIVLCVGYKGHAQTKSEFLSQLYTSHKAYVNTQIQEKERSKYHSYINFGNALLPRIYEEVNRIDSSYWNDSTQTNMFEFFASYGNLKGVLWKSNGAYFSFFLNEAKKLIVQSQSLENLETKFQTIIQSFPNWGSPVFSTHGLALGTPTERPFYMAAKVTSDNVSSIGFYY